MAHAEMDAFHSAGRAGEVGPSAHFISGPGKFQAPYFMCALASFTEIS